MIGDGPKLIIGGEIALPGAYPAYGIPEGFLDGTNGLCGATLIWEDIMLTAAHCFGVFTGFNIYLGANTLDGSDALETKVGVREYYHPDYNIATSNENDIMLVKLDSASTATPRAWNTNPTVPADGDPVTVIGFGVTESGFVSEVLLEVEVSIVNSDTCVANYEIEPLLPVFPETMVCAADTDKDSCQGDS